MYDNPYLNKLQYSAYSDMSQREISENYYGSNPQGVSEGYMKQVYPDMDQDSIIDYHTNGMGLRPNYSTPDQQQNSISSQKPNVPVAAQQPNMPTPTQQPIQPQAVGAIPSQQPKGPEPKAGAALSSAVDVGLSAVPVYGQIYAAGKDRSCQTKF